MNHVSKKGRGPAIDILTLWAKGNSKDWNDFLTDCLRRKDKNTLIDVSQRLSYGMDNLAKQKLNTEEICKQYLRWQKSIDDTLKIIWRSENKNPCYDPLLAKDYEATHIKEKRKLDHEFERFLRSKRY